MAGYIGSKSSVTQVDGYSEVEADAEFVTKTGDTMTGDLDVTGTVTADGLTVDGIATFNAPNSIIRIMESDTTDLNTQIQNNGGDLHIQTVVDNLSSSKDRISLDHATGDISFYEDTGTTAKFFWDASAESLGIGSSPAYNLHIEKAGNQFIFLNNASTNDGFYFKAGTGASSIQTNGGSNVMNFFTSGSERMRIDSSGNLLVNTTNADVGFSTTNGSALHPTGQTHHSSNGTAMVLNRTGSDGTIAQFRKDGTTVGYIGNKTRLYMAGTDMGIYFGPTYIAPVNSLGTLRDNQYNLGDPSYRWDDIYATNGTIQTSDFNEKQDIASLTATEMLVGARISTLFKTFRWKDSVAEKGDNARTHTGVIAQDVQAAFTAEGLDAGDYALFISSTWWEHDVEVPAVEAVEAVEAVTETTTDEEGNEVVTVITEAVEAVEAKDAYTRTDTYDTEAEAPEGATSKTRMGIRYPELLSFVAAYNEQRFASIEARLTALEA